MLTTGSTSDSGKISVTPLDTSQAQSTHPSTNINGTMEKPMKGMLSFCPSARSAHANISQVRTTLTDAGGAATVQGSTFPLRPCSCVYPKLVVLCAEHEALSIMAETQAMVWEWQRDHGPISGWAAALACELEGAVQKDTFTEVAQEWKAQANVGRALLKELRTLIDTKLPMDKVSTRDLIRQAFDLATILLSGIATIDTHLAFFNGS